MACIKTKKTIAMACLALALLSGCNSQQAQWEEYDKLMKADMISKALKTAEEIKADNPNAKNKHGRSITEVIEGTKGALENKNQASALEKEVENKSKAIAILKRVESLTEIGINQKEYSTRLLDENADLSEPLASVEDQAFKREAKDVMAVYADANQYWTDATKDLMKKKEVADAENHLTDAEKHLRDAKLFAYLARFDSDLLRMESLSEAKERAELETIQKQLRSDYSGYLAEVPKYYNSGLVNKFWGIASRKIKYLEIESGRYTEKEKLEADDLYLAREVATKIENEVRRVLADGDFEKALRLEPDNTQALSMKKAADIKKALENGDYLSTLQLDPTNAQALSMKKAANIERIAADLKAAIDKGDFQTALQLDPKNKQALLLKKIDAIQNKAITIPFDSPCTSAAYSPDGLNIVCGSSDSISVLTKKVGLLKNSGLKTSWWEKWSKTSRKQEMFSSTRFVFYSLNGNSIVCGGKIVKTLDSETLKEKQSLMDSYNHQLLIHDSIFSFATRQNMIAKADSFQVGIWNTVTGEKLASYSNSDLVGAIALSPDGSSIVSGARGGGNINLRNISNVGETLKIRGHSTDINCIIFSPDGKSIVSGSQDKTLKIWDAKTGEEKLSLKGHTDGVTSVAFSPDGNSIVSGSYDETIKIWDAKTGSEKLTLKGHKGHVNSVAFSPDRNSIVSGSEDGTIKIWNLKDDD